MPNSNPNLTRSARIFKLPCTELKTEDMHETSYCTHYNNGNRVREKFSLKRKAVKNRKVKRKKVVVQA